MNTVEDIFLRAGGTTAFAKMISIKPSAASEMRRRKSIPVRYWPSLVRCLDIDNDKLVAIHATPTRQNTAA